MLYPKTGQVTQLSTPTNKVRSVLGKTDDACLFVYHSSFTMESYPRLRFLFDDHSELFNAAEQFFRYFKYPDRDISLLVAGFKSYADLFKSPRIAYLTYRKFSEFLNNSSKQKAHDRKILTIKHPQKLDIQKQLSSDIGKKVQNTLPKLPYRRVKSRTEIKD